MLQKFYVSNFVGRLVFFLFLSHWTLYSAFDYKLFNKFCRDGRLLIGSLTRSDREIDRMLENYRVLSSTVEESFFKGLDQCVSVIDHLAKGACLNMRFQLECCAQYVYGLCSIAQKANLLFQRSQKSVAYWDGRGIELTLGALDALALISRINEFWNMRVVQLADLFERYGFVDDEEDFVFSRLKRSLSEDDLADFYIQLNAVFAPQRKAIFG